MVSLFASKQALHTAISQSCTNLSVMCYLHRWAWLFYWPDRHCITVCSRTYVSSSVMVISKGKCSGLGHLKDGWCYPLSIQWIVPQEVLLTLMCWIAYPSFEKLGKNVCLLLWLAIHMVLKDMNYYICVLICSFSWLLPFSLKGVLDQSG